MSSRAFQKCQRGTTLVEVLIVMGLMTIFMLILSSVFTATADIQVRSDSYNAVSAEGRYIMSRLNYDIARSTSISRPVGLGTSNTLLRMVISGVTYNYQLTGSNIQLNDGSGFVNLNGNQVVVSNVLFYKYGNSTGKETIRYTFTLTSVDQDRNGPTTQTFTSTVQRR